MHFIYHVLLIILRFGLFMRMLLLVQRRQLYRPYIDFKRFNNKGRRHSHKKLHFKYLFISFCMVEKKFFKVQQCGWLFHFIQWSTYNIYLYIFNYLIIQTCNYYYTHFIILLVEENYIYTRSKLNDKQFLKEVPFIHVVHFISKQFNSREYYYYYYYDYKRHL